MTKIKNTKKGMAKKTLSMSLVVAMLATSNVPVWAAEFSDGSDVAVETEAPVAEAATEFSDDTVETPAVENDETTAAVATEGASSNLYTGAITFTNVTDNAIEWGKEILADVSVKNAQTGNAQRSVYYAWKINGVAPSYDSFHRWNGEETISSGILEATDAGKTITLMLAVKDDEGKVSWTYESSAITIKKKLISNYVKVNTDAIDSPVYTGKEQKVAVPDNLLNRIDGTTGTNLTNESNYKATYTAKDFINVTDEGITVTLTPDESKLPGYTGEIKYSYKIAPKELDGYMEYQSYMKATLSNTSYAYTGNTITKIKASDITLVDRETGDDLSNYLNVDKDGFVDVIGSPQNVDASNNLWITLIEGTPKKGNKNYNIKGANLARRRIPTDNQMTVVTRDLSTVVATIPQQKYNNGKKV